VRAFQRHHGLHEHGQCDQPTWLALVEASWRLGDRPLRLVAPYLRGDDVGTLQSWLGRLGFDCGRVDGIFGPATARALEDFQRNCGLEVDAILGPATVRALEINSARTGSGPGVATLREIERLDAVDSLHELRVVVGQFGGLGALTRQIAQSLRQLGARVISVDELDPSVQAAAANRYAATVYVGFEAHPDDQAAFAYYATAGFESAGGHALAAARDPHGGGRVFDRAGPAGRRRDAETQRRRGRGADSLGRVTDSRLTLPGLTASSAHQTLDTESMVLTSPPPLHTVGGQVCGYPAICPAQRACTSPSEDAAQPSPAMSR
jgi:N-acetylmuramoyl-L-alanine amidase